VTLPGKIDDPALRHDRLNILNTVRDGNS